MNWLKFFAAALAAAGYGVLFLFYTYAINVAAPAPDDPLGLLLDLMMCLSLMGSAVLCGLYALYVRPFSVWKSDRQRRAGK